MALKLAFSTLPCAGWTLDRLLQVCRDNGIGAIEMRLGLNDWSAPDMTPARAAEVRAALAAQGVRISNLGTSIVIRNYDTAQMAQLLQCAALAEALGTRGLRIMLGTYKVRYSEEAPLPDEAGIVQWLREACAAAALHGAEIWLETHNEYASGAAMRRVLDAVRMPNCRILYDVIHPLEVQETVSDTLAFMGRDIAHVHLKDGRPWDDADLANWEYTRVGQGAIPLAQIVNRLQAQGYSGYYSLEWESAWRPEIRGPGFEGETAIAEFANYMRNEIGAVQ